MPNPRVGKCYELSARFVTDLDENGEPRRDAVLVHGSIQGRGFPRNPHAWVEIEGGLFVFDPVIGQTLPAWLYGKLMNAKVYVRYSYEETLAKLIETENFGPWDDQSEVCRQAKLAADERRGK